jgi:hypothetical protein
MAIGIAYGGLKYLNRKMQDPFINWIPVDIPMSYALDTHLMIKELTEDTLSKHKYRYSYVRGFKRFPMEFWHKNGKERYSLLGRTVEYGDPLLKEIFDKPGNLILGRGFNDDQDIGLIVTTRFLKKLGYDPGKPRPFITQTFNNPLDANNSCVMPLPIIACVNDLPGMSDFFVTPYFYMQRFEPKGDHPFNPSKIMNIELISFENSDKSKKIVDMINDYKNHNILLQKMDADVWIEPLQLAYKPVYSIHINLSPESDTSLRIRDQIVTDLLNDPALKRYSDYLLRYYNFKQKMDPTNNQISNYDKLTIRIDDPRMLESFQTFFFNKYRLRIEMGQVESRKNYFFIASLTLIISITLIIFGILCICLFISNLLKNHLEGMKMNIGTFKAFGIDDMSLEHIYLSIVYIFIISSMIIAFILALLIGNLGVIRLLFTLLTGSREADETFFNLMNYWTASSIIFVLLTSFVVLKYITRKIFRLSPGDLIFDRT